MFATEQIGVMDRGRIPGFEGIVPVLSKSDSSVSPLSVLAVDDCPFERAATVLLLARWGIVPRVAAGGLEAIGLLERRDFDIVLMDIQMPDLDGFETTRQIRDARRQREVAMHLPIVAYTASMLPLDVTLLRFAGIDDVIAKPSDPGTMSRCLLRWCGNKFSASSGPLQSRAHI